MLWLSGSWIDLDGVVDDGFAELENEKDSSEYDHNGTDLGGGSDRL